MVLRSIYSKIPNLYNQHRSIYFLPTLRNSIFDKVSSNQKETKCYSNVAVNHKVDPFSLVRDDISRLSYEICKELNTDKQPLRDIAHYHFDGKGKSIRPSIVLLIAKCCNSHKSATIDQDNMETILNNQRKVAMIAEMIHTASLVHDDVIDDSDTRRGRLSVQKNWGQKNALMAGDYIMSVSSTMLARVGNLRLIDTFADILDDLVTGEFMQLSAKEDKEERFKHYMKKTYKKTASLLSNSCKSVAVLSGCNEQVIENCYEYGKNIGIAFQIVDDILDFVSNSSLMGKPTAADLNLGIATAPVLFAAIEYPELNDMIIRQFSHQGDVQLAWDLVQNSKGIQRSKELAEQHSEIARKAILFMPDSPAKKALIDMLHVMLKRMH